MFSSALIYNVQLYKHFFQNFSMTGITFNLIIIRIGQERANTKNDLVDSQFVAGELRQLSALRSESTSQS
jgi:hypothetical protein